MLYQEIVNQIVPVAVAALFGILVAVIKAVGSAVIRLIEKKREEIETKIGIESYHQRLEFAREVWNLVDEAFRISPQLPKTIEAKREKFSEQIKKFIPGITDEEIVRLRQIVAGEINKGREAIEANALPVEKSGSEN